MVQLLGTEIVRKLQFLGTETDQMVQFLGTEKAQKITYSIFPVLIHQQIYDLI